MQLSELSVLAESRSQGHHPSTSGVERKAEVHSSQAIFRADAGLKRFATDGPVPTIAAGAPPGATYGFKGDARGA